MQRHKWRERTADGVRFFQAGHHGGEWTLQSQLKGEEEWTVHDPITIEEWRCLRDVLWRKYQRGRGPWEFIERIDKILEAEGESESEERENGAET